MGYDGGLADEVDQVAKIKYREIDGTKGIDSFFSFSW